MPATYWQRTAQTQNFATGAICGNPCQTKPAMTAQLTPAGPARATAHSARAKPWRAGRTHELL
eukprot:1348077-Lingulodinium_polyedra.AAC.1